MELFFNAIWFLLAGAMLGHWAWFRETLYPQTRDRSGCWLTLLSLAGALLVAFPAISMSDDLQQQPLMCLEKTEASRAQLKSSSLNTGTLSDHSLNSIMLPAHALVATTAIAGAVVTAEPLAPGWNERPVSAGRAPPFRS